MSRMPLTLLLAALALGGCATDPAGGDPTASLQEAQMTLRAGPEGERIEEYRVAGQLKVVKVVPLRGAPFYLIDRDGDGHLDSSKGDAPVSPVYWKLFGW